MSLFADLPADVLIIPPERQGYGAFDNGRITERKPIGMPQDGSMHKRIGPLFYWAWARADGTGKIGLHPHNGFEIMSYVLTGTLAHRDTLGNRQQVGPGGAQVMQTGSGVSHEEEVAGADASFFQIWFEPYLMEAFARPPTYAAFEDADFPHTTAEGVTIKTLLGPGAPVTLVADAAMVDVTLATDRAYPRALAEGRSLACLAVEGGGTLAVTDGQTTNLRTGELAIIHAHRPAEITLTARPDGLRVACIEVPTSVDYPLYPKR